MFKNNYDTDITTWSPAGRLYQVEYANEAVKQGSSTVAVKNRDYVVLVALKRSPTAELSSYQEKIFRLNQYLGMSLTGLVSDGRELARFLRTESMNYEYSFNANIPVPKAVQLLGEKLQRHTLDGHKRPFGVGLLIAGYNHIAPTTTDELDDPDVALTTDKAGARMEEETGKQKGTAYLYQTLPSAEIHRVVATAIGNRSQSARTYLEKYYLDFKKCSKDELIVHALKALSFCTNPYEEDTFGAQPRQQNERQVRLNTQNTTIAIVGVDTPLTILSDEDVNRYISRVVIRPEDQIQDEGSGDEGAPAGGEDNESRPMDLED